MLKQLRHLKAVNSVSLRAATRAAIHFLPDYHWGDGTSRSVANITLELTYRCQWKCGFCFLKENVLNRRVDELSFEELVEIVDAAVPMKCSFFLTGGEPFVRRDAIPLIQEIKKRGLKVGVNTNHVLLDEEDIDTLRETGLNYLISSIHGPPDVHEQVTGTDSYARVKRNLSYWSSKPRSTRIIINYAMTPETVGHLSHMVEFAAETGVDLLTFQHESFLTQSDIERHEAMWPELFDEPSGVELSYADVGDQDNDADRIIECIGRANERAKELGVDMVVKPGLSDEEIRMWYSGRFHMDGKCSYLYTDIRINPRGELITCQPIPYVVGNVREAGAFELFNSEPFKEFRRQIQRAGGFFPACARCCKMHRKL